MPFNSMGLHSHLVRATRELEYKEPTPVQAGAIPPALAGRDVIATAQTGTGKTAAFLLPVLHRLLDQPRDGVRAVVVSPTRELAEQISEVCRVLARHTALKSTLVVGGRPFGPQERILRTGPDVIVATPGRLLDHLQQGTVRLDRVSTLVLDEADSMLDMGFLPDVKRIIARMPARKHTLLFSATMPPVIAKLAAEILRNPASIQIGRRTAAAVGITQAAYPVPSHLKTALLRHLLRETEMPSVLVFTRTKHSAKKLARVVAADGFSVAELHSNRSPSQRTQALEGFRRGNYQVMVATNIAARGIDVNHITHVISTDVPDVPEDYVHRVGRTGRAGAAGDAFILVAREEEASLARIERQVGVRLPRVILPDFDYRQQPISDDRHMERRAPAGSGHRGKASQQNARPKGGHRTGGAARTGGANHAPRHRGDRH